MSTPVLVAGASIFAFIDPAWAPVINTTLIIILAYMNTKQARKIHNVEKAALDAKRAAGADRRNDAKPDTGQRRRWDDH